MKVGDLHIGRESGPKPDPVVELFRAEAAQAWKFHAVIESQMRHRVAEIAALQGAVRDLDGRISKMEHDALRALAVRVTQLEAQI